MYSRPIRLRLLCVFVAIILSLPVVALAAAKPKSVVITSEQGVTSSVKLNVGDKAKLTLIAKPDTSSTGNIRWSSNKKSVAYVNKNGVVTAKAQGTATITAKAKNGGKSDKITIKVTDPSVPKSISLSESGTIKLNLGSTIKIIATLYPDTASSSIKWSSSNKNVAKVSKKGVVTPVKEGKATITVKTVKGGKTAHFKIKVIDPKKPRSIALTEIGTIKMDKGEKLSVKYTLSPSTASSSVTWKSSNTKIASVSKKGVVKAKAKGKATITATTKNGGKKASFVVKVSNTKYVAPTPTPTILPTATIAPTVTPTTAPTPTPTPKPTPTASPTAIPTNKPTATPTPQGLYIKSCTISGNPKLVGDKIIWTTEATGGKDPYKYSYALHRDGFLEDLILSNPSNVFSYETKKAGIYSLEVTVWDSEYKKATYTSVNVIIQAPENPGDAGATAVNAPSTNYVPSSVGMHAEYTSSTSTSISFTLYISTTFGQGLTDYGILWETPSGTVRKSSMRIGDVSGASFSLKLNNLTPGTEYTVVGYALKDGVLLRSAGFKITIPE